VLISAEISTAEDYSTVLASTVHSGPAYSSANSLCLFHNMSAALDVGVLPWNS